MPDIDKQNYAAPSDPVALPPALHQDMIDVLRATYGGGYINKKPSFDELRALRAKSYRVLKHLGLEK